MEFEFPDTGEGVTEGKFLRWLVEEGERVEEDQAVAEAETDKAVIEVPSPEDGTVRKLEAEPGETVEVGDVIMEIDTEESGTESNGDAESATADSEEKDRDRSTYDGSTDSGVLALPKVRKLAEEEGVNLEKIDANGRITEEDVREASEPTEDTSEQSRDEGSRGVRARPSVRKLAREKGVEINQIDGTGRDGEVTRSDVEEAAEKTGDEPEKRDSGDETEENPPETEKKRVEMSRIRKAVSDHVEKSRFTAPHVTHVEKADLTRLSDLRERVNEGSEDHLTYLPFIMKAVAESLRSFPDLNAELDEENDEIVRYRSMDFNFAVDTDRGLLNPVIEDVRSMSISEISDSISRKAERARDGELDPSEMQNGTFTLTNLGAIGGKEFTPIINYPQVAILGIGEISETAEVVEGEVTPRTTVKLSLSYDHRVIDGADAARFMNDLVKKLESPGKLMVNL
ncbi:MAG: 2-oxo acid dehydrogenase subunit E2 [Candidatus Nanohaloarchaea archaeon]